MNILTVSRKHLPEILMVSVRTVPNRLSFLSLLVQAIEGKIVFGFYLPN